MTEKPAVFSPENLEKSVNAAVDAAPPPPARTGSLEWNVTPEAGEVDLGIQKDTPRASWSLTGWVRRKWSGSDKTSGGVKGGVKW